MNNIPNELIDKLGNAGLPERLDEATLTKGIEHSNEIIAIVHDMGFKREPHLGDDTLPGKDFYNAINALGAIYPLLFRGLKNEALCAYLNQFDGINYYYVQINHTPYIREPLVLADICVVRRLYWLGLDEGKEKVKSCESFAEFKENLMMSDGKFDPGKVKSDFCVAYAVLRSDMSSYGSDYAKACYPYFLERVVKGIVNMRFGPCETKADIKKGHARLRELLPSELHPLIDRYYKEKGWVDKSNFPV